MWDTLLVVMGFGIAMGLTEVVLSGTKLQTGLPRVLMVHAAIAGLLLIYFAIVGRFSIVAILVFWAGAFLTWFGVRSHIESSILLRMIHSLRRGPALETDLLNEYESLYGESLRLKELFVGKLLEQTGERIVPTAKGRFILRIVAFLK